MAPGLNAITMRRWLLFGLCALLGLTMLLGGLLVPAHLRALDASVLQIAGEKTPSLVEHGLALAQTRQSGAAEMLLRAAQELQLPGTEALGRSVSNLAVQNPDLWAWGAPPPESLASTAAPPNTDSPEAPARSQPVTDLMVRRDYRERTLELLRVSTRPAVQNLISCRKLTQTVVFSPSQSASGQALDTAIGLCGLLLQERHLTPSLSDAISTAALQARYGNDSEPLEQILLDLMSLGQRMSWGQLVAFLERVEKAETLRQLADQLRNAQGRLPVVFAAVRLSENPAGVAGYLAEFTQTGVRDLGASLPFGSGGVATLLQRHQRLSDSNFRQHLPESQALDSAMRFAATAGWKWPRTALVAKWVLYFLSGFFIAAAMHFARRPVSALERPLQVRGFHLARETLFALGFLLVVLLWSEPYLTQERQKAGPHFRLRLPSLSGAIHAENPITSRSFMNQVNLLTLLLFFVLQALIYTACVIKLAEIRRQKVPPHMKLRLLENEDHLFDAGLYLGFVGTIISLILVSMGITSFSLMAAYSSTSFGIIFVSFFKIFHLRAARRQLLLEAEPTAEQGRATKAPALTQPS
jgi:hypothetical protein